MTCYCAAGEMLEYFEIQQQIFLLKFAKILTFWSQTFLKFNPLTPADTDLYLIFSEPRRLFLFEEKRCFSLQNPSVKMYLKRFNVGIFEILSPKKVRASRSRRKSQNPDQIPARSPCANQIIHSDENADSFSE